MFPSSDWQRRVSAYPTSKATICSDANKTRERFALHQVQLREKGDLLKYLVGQQINNIFGNPIWCERRWTAPMNVTWFMSAINRLHQLRNHMGQYSDKCPDCLALPQERHHIGCKAHEPCPCFCREGNSIKDGSLLISCKGNMKQQREQTTTKALIDPHHISPTAAFVGIE